MKFTNQFSVSVPIDQVWEVLLDVRRVAGYLPGATVDAPSGGSDIYRGKMKIKLGPILSEYGGDIQVVRADAAEHIAVLAIEAQELRGQGTAKATITNRLTSTEEGTLVVVESDVDVTGRQAQLGHGIIENVANRMLADFAKRFEAELTGAGTASAGDAEVLDVGTVVLRSKAAKVAVGLAALGLAAAAVMRVQRKRG